MPFNYVLLKTDLLFYILILAALGYVLYARRHEHLLAPWKQVVRRPQCVWRNTRARGRCNQ